MNPCACVIDANDRARPRRTQANKDNSMSGRGVVWPSKWCQRLRARDAIYNRHRSPYIYIQSPTYPELTFSFVNKLYGRLITLCKGLVIVKNDPGHWMEFMTWVCMVFWPVKSDWSHSEIALVLFRSYIQFKTILMSTQLNVWDTRHFHHQSATKLVVSRNLPSANNIFHLTLGLLCIWVFTY